MLGWRPAQPLQILYSPVGGGEVHLCDMIGMEAVGFLEMSGFCTELGLTLVVGSTQSFLDDEVVLSRALGMLYDYIIALT